MMQPESMTDETIFTELVGDLDVPCRYHEFSNCGPAAAGWVLFLVHGCGLSVRRLSCTGCKDIILTSLASFVCPGCDDLIIPAREAVVMIEAL